jgi:hypothetical protein
VGLERGPLSLLSTIQELIGRKNSGCGLENREYGRGELDRPSDPRLSSKLVPTFADRGCHVVSVVLDFSFSKSQRGGGRLDVGLYIPMPSLCMHHHFLDVCSSIHFNLPSHTLRHPLFFSKRGSLLGSILRTLPLRPLALLPFSY